MLNAETIARKCVIDSLLGRTQCSKFSLLYFSKLSNLRNERAHQKILLSCLRSLLLTIQVSTVQLLKQKLTTLQFNLKQFRAELQKWPILKLLQWMALDCRADGVNIQFNNTVMFPRARPN